MGVAVEFERFILTATDEHRHSLTVIPVRGKLRAPDLTSGGYS